jgi:glycosyltransferase involved in cell wall biosynthesis
LKILLFHTYNQGYLSSFFHELSVRLIREGHVVVSFSWKATVSERLIDGVKVIVKKKKGYLNSYIDVYTVIKREKPDVVLSNFSYVNPALLFGKLFGVKKSLVWFHSLNKQMESSKRNVFIKTQFLKLADTIIANSFLTKDELEQFYEVSGSKIHAIPFWSTISEQEIKPTSLNFSIHKNVVKIGCPGRMATHKNQKIIIEALAKLNTSSHSEFHLYFAGEGEELSDLKTQVEELALDSKVTFLKHLSANDMYHFYSNVDVVILPSLHEAFGLVFIEAISLGTPVIVSSNFGALSFINDGNKTLSKVAFNPKSVMDLQEKLIPYLEHNGLAKDYFKRLYHDNFNKDLIFNSFLNIISID